MDSSEPKKKPTELPDVVIEHGQSRISIDLDFKEWFIITILIVTIASLGVKFGIV